MWEKISSTEELICYEKKGKVSVRLEARDSGEGWMIYRGYYMLDHLNYTEEYSAQTRDEAERMILQLKKEKDLTQNEITKLMKEKSKRIQLNMKRAYRDDVVEKWFFTIDRDNIQNFFIVRDCDKVELDVVINQKYAKREKDILKEISSVLSLDEVSIEVEYNVYFFSKKSEHFVAQKKHLVGSFELGFDRSA